MPSKNAVHVDAALTNLSIAYTPGGFIADQAMPILKVAKESDKYYKWDRGNALRVPKALRSDGAESNKLTFDISTATYQAEEYAYNSDITDRQTANSDSIINLRASKTRFLKDLLMLDREKRVASLLTTAGNYDSSVRETLSGTKQWDNASFVGSIEKDLDAAKEAVRGFLGLEPNTIIIPAAVAKVMKRDAMIRELIKYTQTNLLVNGDLPPTIFNMRVLIPTAINITSQRGASSTTNADVWGKHIVLTYQPPNGSIDTPAHAYTMRSRNFLAKSWREEEKAKDVIELSVIEDVIVTSNVSGFLYSSVIS